MAANHGIHELHGHAFEQLAVDVHPIHLGLTLLRALHIGRQQSILQRGWSDGGEGKKEATLRGINKDHARVAW
jgi:hypothetical protein